MKHLLLALVLASLGLAILVAGLWIVADVLQRAVMG